MNDSRSLSWVCTPVNPHLVLTAIGAEKSRKLGEWDRVARGKTRPEKSTSTIGTRENPVSMSSGRIETVRARYASVRYDDRFMIASGSACATGWCIVATARACSSVG